MNLENLNVQEMSAKEQLETDGGNLFDFLTENTSWSGTGNPIAYFGEAVYNGLVIAYNAHRAANAFWANVFG